MTVLGDRTDPRSWVRNWPRLDLHDVVDYELDLAYEAGRQHGREEFAGELLTALRWVLAGLGTLDLALVDPDELQDIHDLLHGDLGRLMSRAIRHMEQARARREADADAAFEVAA